MLKEYYTIFKRLTMFVDLCLVAASFFMGYFIRDTINNIYPLKDYLWILPIFLFMWGVLLNSFRMYESFRVRYISDVLFIVFKTAFVGLTLFGGFAYIFKLQFISRAFISFVFLVATALIIIEKIAVIFFFRHIRRRGYNLRNILIVGTGKRAQHFMSIVDEHAEWGLQIIGLVDEDAAKVGQTLNGYKVIGSFGDIPQIIHNNIVDEVVFVVPRSWLNKIEDIMNFCETEGLKINIAVDYFELKLAKARQSDLSGFPLLTFESTPIKPWQLLTKCTFDLAFSLFMLILLLPVFIVVAIIIKLTSSGDIFFRQKRCGLNGRVFRLYKFRTMVQGAEEKLNELMAQNEMVGPVFKMKKDPRITPIGSFLRKTSIDELPQFWNVFRGDMSLIGPRPPIPTEVNKYDNWQRRRLSMRPGITCLWQVSGRNKITDFNEWARLDLEYIDKWSLWLDIKIFLRTIPVVLFGIGAK